MEWSLVWSRLTPEYPFPAAFEDCKIALESVVENIGEFGVNMGRIFVVAGSGGATLVAGLAL